MKKATQLREELTGVLANDEIDRVVKSAVDAGTVENDIDYTPAIDPDALDVALEAVKKAMNIVATEEEEVVEEVSKSLYFEESTDDDDDDDDDYVDVTDVLDTITKGADSLLAEMRHEHQVLATAITEMSAAYREIAKGVNTLSGRVGDLEGKTEEVQKGLALVPERRSMSGTVETVPHPSEDSAAPLDRAALINKGLSLLESSTDVMAQTNFSKAISLLEAGADPNQVAANYNLH